MCFFKNKSDYDHYFEYVEELAANNRDSFFLNKGADKGDAVTSRIFKYSKDRIIIFCLDFSNCISTFYDLEYWMKKFLKKGGKLQILYHGQLPKHILQNKRIECVRTETKVEMGVGLNGFIIGDNKMYRIIDHRNITTANFNSQELAERFVKLFDDILAKEKLLTA